MDDKELTYGEHVEAFNKGLLKKYVDEVQNIIRNLVITKNDMDNIGFLKESYVNKLSDDKALLLNAIKIKYESKMK